MSCAHTEWKRRNDLNRLFAAGEDGEFGWECLGCGCIAYSDDLTSEKRIAQPLFGNRIRWAIRTWRNFFR